MTAITSLQNPRVQGCLAAARPPASRKAGAILIDGTRELERAIRGGVRLREVFVCEPLCAGPDAQRLLERLLRSGAEVLQVTEAVFAKLTFGQHAEGVLGVAEMPSFVLDQLVLPDNPRVAVLEGVEKPGNVGAVLYSADGAGISAVIVADGRTDLYNPNAIRSSLGDDLHPPRCAPRPLRWPWIGSPPRPDHPCRDRASLASPTMKSIIADRRPSSWEARPAGSPELGGSRGHRGAIADGRHGRQPERFRCGGRTVLRIAPPAPRLKPRRLRLRGFPQENKQAACLLKNRPLGCL